MVTEETKGLIESVINGDYDSVGLPLTLPCNVCTFLEDKGFEESEIEFNGWQGDYWITFEKDDNIFTLAGSGYYGGQSFREGI